MKHTINKDYEKIENKITNFDPNAIPYTDDDGVRLNNRPIIDGLGRFHGQYPNSLLTLFYPHTLFRDVVLDQPINVDTDRPFFWHAHKTDEIIIKAILTKCYGLELVELNSREDIEWAKQTNLTSMLTKRQVITSPLIRQVAEIFTTKNFGRMFSFFRHPLDYDIHEDLSKEYSTSSLKHEDNFFVRILSNQLEGDVGFKQLGVAKKVIFQTCTVGTIDKMKESMIRIASYWGWEFLSGQDEMCIDNVMLETGIPIKETFVDHTSSEWVQFYERNQYDCQLYELIQSVWRAQIQTIIPLELQISRDADSEDKSD